MLYDKEAASGADASIVKAFAREGFLGSFTYIHLFLRVYKATLFGALE